MWQIFQHPQPCETHMENNIVISVYCPICGHHLVGYGAVDGADVHIDAYCSLCDKNYIFNSVLDTPQNKSDGDNGNDTSN